MARIVADYMAETLKQAGVKRVYGVVGDTLNGFTDALRRSKVGDVVEVKVLRDGQPVTASVKLEQRK